MSGRAVSSAASAREYLNIDVAIVRILWAVAALCGSAGFWAYLACAILLPDKP